MDSAGGVFAILADPVERPVIQPAEFPVGVLTACVRPPLMWRRRQVYVLWRNEPWKETRC